MAKEANQLSSSQSSPIEANQAFKLLGSREMQREAREKANQERRLSREHNTAAASYRYKLGRPPPTSQTQAIMPSGDATTPLCVQALPSFPTILTERSTSWATLLPYRGNPMPSCLPAMHKDNTTTVHTDDASRHTGTSDLLSFHRTQTWETLFLFLPSCRETIISMLASHRQLKFFLTNYLGDWNGGLGDGIPSDQLTMRIIIRAAILLMHNGTQLYREQL